MNNFRRWTSSLYTKFEDLIDQVESQDVLASDALSDMSTSLVRAHDQLERIERECRSLKRELHTAREASRNWKNRAILERDEKCALEYLRRSRTAQVCELDMRDRLDAQKRARDHVQATLSILEERFQTLRAKRLRAEKTQQSTAQRDEVSSHHRLPSVRYHFARFELRSSDQDGPLGYTRSIADSFAESYFQKEEEKALQEELHALRSSSGEHKH
jgi:phage shock protein A